ncbi:MAG: aldehyde dehydrogenase PuuC, partial [Candidatus Planktophila sp.]|nr:aldehyde dehydrogenase PuuC [Candidatus Planktophila sp.]
MNVSTNWHQRALELKPKSQMFIDGKYVDAASGKTFEDIAPHDDRLIAHVASGDVEDIDRAVKSAKKV